MEKSQSAALNGAITLNPQVRLTFTHKVTRDQLIANLDRILKLNGCLACGLNGIDSIVFKGDPYERFADLRQDILRGQVENVLNVEIENHIQQTQAFH
jgi:hypothetical protein